MNEDQYIEDLIQAGASDDEIVEALALFRQRGDDGGGREEVIPPQPTTTEDRPLGFARLTDPETYREIGKDIGDVVGTINKGATRFIPDILKTVGAVEETVGGKGYFTKAGEAIEEGIEYMNPVDPEFEQSFGGQVLSGVGQIAPLVATAGMGAAPKLLSQAPKVEGFLGGAKILGQKLASPSGVIAGSSMAAPEWEAAKEAGLSNEQALGVAAQNYFLGLSETFPIERGLELIKILRATGISPINYVKAAGAGGISEFIQEGFQSYMTNQIANDSYDPDRDPMFGVLESASVGGVVGTLIPFMGAAISATSNPETKAKLQKKLVSMQAAQAIDETDTGNPAVNQEIDQQTEEILKSVEEEGAAPLLSNQATGLTTTPVDIPSIDQTTGEDITKKGEEFTFQDAAGEAKGTIVEDAASIQEIFAATDEEGNPKKGGNLYEKVITALQDRGINTVVVGAQSQGSSATLKRLVEKGVLSVDPTGDVTVGDQTINTRFKILSSTETSPSPPTTTATQEGDTQTSEVPADPIQALELQAGMITMDARGKAEPTGAQLGENLKGADRKATVVEQIADALRGKVETRGAVIDFQDNWNERHPDNPISNAEAAAAWNLIKKAPKDKGPTVTTPINELLKEQVKNFYRGVEKGVRKGQKLVNEQLIPKVQEALKGAKLTPRQTSAILGKVRKTNLFTPGSISRLNAFIDKISTDAQYAENLAKARQAQKRLKKFGRQKAEKIPVSYKVLARQFARLNPSEINNIEEYIDKANEIIGGFRPVNAPNYAAPNISSLESYIDKNLKTQEEQKEKDITGEEEDTVDKIGELKTIAEGSKEQLEEKDLSVFDKREQGMIETIKKIDLNQLDEDQLRRFIKIIDNIVENDDLSGEGYIEAVAKAHDTVRGLEEKINSENAKTSEVGWFGRSFYNPANLFKRIYQNSGIEAFIRKNIHGPLIQAGSQTEIALHDAGVELDEAIKKLNKKYKTELRDIDNKADMMVFSLLYQMENESDMQKMHRNIKETINRNRTVGNDTEADAWQKSYDKFKDVTSFEQAKEIIDKNNPAVYELWKFFGTDQDNKSGLFSDEIAAEGARTAKEVYNREYVPTTRYTPLVQHNVSVANQTADTIEEGSQKPAAKIDPSQSRTAKRRTLALAKGKAYTLEPYSDWILRYGETIYDNKAAKAELMIAQVLRHPSLSKLVGGPRNIEAITGSFLRMVMIQRGTNRSVVAEHESEALIAEFAKSVRTIGVVKALASFSQFIKQSTVTVKTLGNLLATGNTDVFIPAVRALKSTKRDGSDPVSKLIGQSTLISRGLRLGGTDRGTSEAYKLNKGVTKWLYKTLEKARTTIDKRSRASLTWLVRTDVGNAKLAFLSYYMENLKKQGIKFDMNTEYQKQDDPARQTAMAYAENMIEQTQTASNPAALSAFQSQSSSRGWEIIKTMFLPFSTFDADFKARLVNEVSALRRSPSKETSVKLAATVGEAATFAMVSGVWLYWYKEWLKKAIEELTGVDAPEKTEEEHAKGIRQRALTSLTNGINPLAIGSVPQDVQQKAINQLGFILDNPENLSKKDWMKKNAYVFESRDGSILEQLGAYSSGIAPVLETFDMGEKAITTALGAPVKVVDAYGNEKMIRFTDEQERILYLKFVVESLTMAGITEADIANAVRAIYREQLRSAPKADENNKTKSSLKLNKPKSLNLKK